MGDRMGYKIFAVNPGSTSTKIALFDGDKKLFSVNVSHDAEKLKEFATIAQQLPYREETISSLLEENKVDLNKVDAFVGRGGGLLGVEGGTYAVNDILLDHAVNIANGVPHPATLGPQLAHKYAEIYGKKAYVVNPPDTDELQDAARVSGIKGVYRNVHLHALNLKETAIRHAEAMGKRYEDCNFIVCHIGGGVSVSAHDHGKMIDGNDIVGGDGPMAPTRCGAIPVIEILNYMERTGADVKEVKSLIVKKGGFVSLLGTSDAREVTARIAEGDKQAELVWNAFIYQIEKFIGSMAAALKGKVDGILLGGGIVYDKGLVETITEDCGFIAPVSAYPGEFEMEAMAAGVIRVLEGKEELKEYLGVPAWKGFDFDEK